MSDWQFRFPYYVSKDLRIKDGLLYDVTKKYFFITYWLVRCIHGEERLRKDSARAWLNAELGSADYDI